MRFYQGKHSFYCGVDMHARSMYICLLDKEGDVVIHRNLPNDPAGFLGLMTPYRAGLVVAMESTFNWYWLADFCQDEGLAFVLGHALYMKAIHGGKAKNDRIDAEKIARLLQGGLLPMSYVYPREMRAVRDLLRRRLGFVRHRAELYTHIHLTNAQVLQPALGYSMKFKYKRPDLPGRFENPDVRKTVEADLALIEHYDGVIRDLEKYIRARAKKYFRKELNILESVPGIGLITGLTILFEMNTVERFPTVQQFASYARLVKCTKESAGKKYGHAGAKIGNSYLKWAFSEAAVHAAQYSDGIAKHLQRLENRYGKGKGKSLLAHRLGKAVYHMLRRGTVFNEERFLKR